MSTPYAGFRLQTGTPITMADVGNFVFSMDGGDLYCIKRAKTGTGAVEVHVLRGGDEFHSFSLETGTPITMADVGNFVFSMDGGDLYCIKRANTGTGAVEVHVLRGGDEFHSFSLQTGTPIPLADAGNFVFAVDGGDLYCLKRANTGSGTTLEVHVLNGGDSFHSFSLHAATPLVLSDVPNFDFAVDGEDVDCLKRANTGTGDLEVHILDHNGTVARLTPGSNKVANFLPSTSGLHFSNSYPPGTQYPVISLPIVGTVLSGDAGNGLCGGFVYTVLDLFMSTPRLQPPPNTNSDMPSPGSVRFNYLADRLVDSFGSPPAYNNAAKAIEWIQTPSHDVTISFYGKGLGRRMVEDELPQIKADIDCGRPSPLMLVMKPECGFMDLVGIPVALGRGHQVLAYAYSLDNANNLTLWIYDCNDPDDDASTITMNIARPEHTIFISAPTLQSHIKDPADIRGLFRSDYSYQNPAPFVAGATSTTTAQLLSSGKAEIPGTYEFDFDSGVVTESAAADIFWDQFSATRRAVIPINGAGIANLGKIDFENLTVAQLKALTYTAPSIDGSDGSNVLVAGDVFAVRTNGGNFAKAQVIGLFDPMTNHGLPIQWVTFPRAA